jgi:hypothetical protein
MRASNLPAHPPPYLLKGLEDDDSAWNLVENRPVVALTPARPGKNEGFLPEGATVIFADTSVRWFESNEWVLTGPVTRRLGGDRQELREVAEAREFEWSPGDERETYHRGSFSVEVDYEGDTAIFARRRQAGAEIGMPFSGPGARVAALDWLTRYNPGQA